MSDPRDRAEEYLSDLRAGLELAPEEAELVVAETEDHLRETAACGLATGMTEHEAQLAAISASGSVSAVVRACASRPAGFIRGRTAAVILGDLVLAGWKLAGTGLIPVGVSGPAATRPHEGASAGCAGSRARNAPARSHHGLSWIGH